MTVSLFTAIFDRYDTPKPLPDGHGFDEAIMFVDNSVKPAEGWSSRFHNNIVHPRLDAKRPKMMPFNFTNADICVWIDGSFEIVDIGFKDFCVDALGDKDFIVWQHPDIAIRDCLYKEAQFCQDWPKYKNQPIREQVEFYRSEGMPENFGLWACGTIVWRNTEMAKAFGEEWFMQNQRWSIQDQISFPYLVWKMQPNFGVFPDHEYDNRFINWVKHNSEL